MKKLILIISLLSFLTNSYSQDFWHQTNGPYGGATVRDFLYYTDSTIFLATYEGIIKSSDNGESWNRIPEVTKRIYCLKDDHLGALYAGANDEYNNPYLLKSTDEGDSWIAMNTNFWADIKDIFIPYRDTIIVGSWDKGLYRSFDYGVTWEQINNGIEYSAVYKIILLSNGELLVGSNGGGIYKSTNWGNSWFPSNNGIPVNPLGYRHAESFCETSPGEIFTGTHNGIYYSSNYGNNWIYKGNGIADYHPARCIVKDDQGTLYAGIDISHGVYYSTNNGNEWYHLGLGYSIYTLGWDSDSRLYAGGSSQGLHRYIPEDTTWTQVYNRGYTPIDVTLISQSENGNLVVSTKWWGVYVSTNQGQLWERTNYAGYEIEHLESINDSIIIGGNYSGVYVSNDTGRTWTLTTNIPVTSLYYDSTNELLYLAANNGTCGIYQSNDYGQSWILLTAFEITWQYQWVHDLHITGNNQFILASVIYGDRWSSIYRFYRSTDVGETWELIAQDPYRLVFYVEEDNSGNIYAINSTQLLVSSDEGDTWVIRSIPNSNCISSDYSGRIYRAHGWGIYYSTDEGITWLEMDRSGLGNSDINDIKINKNNRIYLATENGVFIGDADSIVVGIGTKGETSKTYFLSQNYPNPFNPTTTIKYQIPERSFVILKVYDVLGNEIATLVNEEKVTGSYDVDFDAQHLPSGIYLYRLQAGQFVETKKMILMK